MPAAAPVALRGIARPAVWLAGAWNLLNCAECGLLWLHPQVGYRPGRRVAFNSWVLLAVEEARQLCDGKAGDTLHLIATRA